MIKKYLLPIGIMAGAVIGAGIFSLPYVFVRVGVLNGFIFLIIGTLIMTLGHLFYGDLVLGTKGKHNFVGLSQIYFGKLGGFLGILISILQMILVLLIYLVLSQSFTKLIFNQATITQLLVFWAVGSSAIFLTLKRLAAVEFAIVVGVITIIVIVFLFSAPKLSSIELNSAPLYFGNFLIALAPILFALGGRASIVETVRYAKFPKNIKWSIISGTAIPALVYGLFALAVVVLSPQVSEDSVTGLIGYLPSGLLALLGGLGLLSILSAYIAIGFDVNDVLKTDLRWPFFGRFLLIVLTPLGLYLGGLQNFFGLVSFTGGVFGALTYIFIAVMWLKFNKLRKGKPLLLKRVPAGLIILLIALFIMVAMNQVYIQFNSGYLF